MKELRETQLQYIDKSDFLKGQLLMLFPMLLVWIGGLAWLMTNPRYRIIGWIYLLVIVLLITGSGKAYYSLGAYPMLLAAGGVWLEKISRQRIWMRYAFIFIILLLSLPFIPVLLPMQPPVAMDSFNKKYQLEKLGLLKWEDLKDHPLQQDFADMLGWKEMTEKSELFYNSLPDSIRSATIIYCRHYGQAGALKYYAKGAIFRSKTICDNGTFLFWIPRNLQFTNLIYIGRKIPLKDDVVFNHFEKVTLKDSVTNIYSRQLGDKIIFFQNADSMAVKLATAGLDKMRSVFE